MQFSREGRLVAGVVAAVAWVGLGLYVVAESAGLKGDWIGALWLNAGFLTDLSNLSLAIVMTGVALGVRLLSAPHVVGWVTAVIATVGVGFWLIGGSLIVGETPIESFLLHAVTPWAGLAFWLIFAPKGGLRWRRALIWLAWPALYFTYAMTRGALSGEYAYPFLDPQTDGIAGAMMGIGKIVAVYVAWCLVLLRLDRMMSRKR
ncbi:MAG TPA: Pr6Pr family membrane protein [Hyphomonadaceae bacterium]|nr:Pr6Pr family membrane protein [Hyphomonadaceae bacterium]